MVENVLLHMYNIVFPNIMSIFNVKAFSLGNLPLLTNF